jgi:hypothetical protein
MGSTLSFETRNGIDAFIRPLLHIDLVCGKERRAEQNLNRKFKTRATVMAAPYYSWGLSYCFVRLKVPSTGAPLSIYKEPLMVLPVRVPLKVIWL